MGYGGCGITYKAHSTKKKKTVAIKELCEMNFPYRNVDNQVLYSSEKEFKYWRNAFVNEALTVKKLSATSANIVVIYEILSLNNTVYIVMEYCEGGSLKDRLLPLSKEDKSMSRPLTERYTRTLLVKLTEGLRLIHAHGMCHRDIAPDNILFRNDATPIIIDFGAARYWHDAEGREDVTITTKNGYSPEEQYSGVRAKMGPWSDIYAVAAVAYKCLTGKKLVVSKDGRREDFEKLTENFGYSHFLASMDWALSVNRQDRPQSVEQWLYAWSWGPPEKLSS